MEGVAMLSNDAVENLFKKHNGIMRTHELLDAHIYYKDIQQLIQQGLIEKVRYGYYQWASTITLSEVITVARLFPDAVLCMDTALFHYRYSDRTPLTWHLAVSKDSNKSRFKLDYPFVKAYFVEPSIGALLELFMFPPAGETAEASCVKNQVIGDLVRQMNQKNIEALAKMYLKGAQADALPLEEVVEEKKVDF